MQSLFEEYGGTLITAMLFSGVTAAFYGIFQAVASGAW